VISPGPGGIAPALSAIHRAEEASRIIVEPERLVRVAEAARRGGRRIVFTNGVFDLVHLGHLRLLEQARRLGDILIVGINSDDSTRRIKGAGRPVVPQFARAEHLVRLRAVDWCVIFTEDDPRRLLSLLRPDVLAKGSDYRLSGVVGARLVSSWGGRVVRVPIVEGLSTTATISGIRGGRRP
jgi:D-beta-D-heptose 7-phosphate kinase/D-beta-D-heptose 1-phosphate adenosyltransferase